MRRLAQFGWLLLPLCGLLIWAVYFLAAYSFAAVACAHGFAHDIVLGGSALLTVPVAMAFAAVALILLAWWRLERAYRRADPNDERRFIVQSGRIASILSLIAIALGSLPPILMTC